MNKIGTKRSQTKSRQTTGVQLIRKRRTIDGLEPVPARLHACIGHIIQAVIRAQTAIEIGQISLGIRNLSISGSIIEEKGIRHLLLCAFIDQHGDVGIVQCPCESVRAGISIQ
ncbi:hypothetical protein D3C75_1000310 [compost metagenome]